MLRIALGEQPQFHVLTGSRAERPRASNVLGIAKEMLSAKRTHVPAVHDFPELHSGGVHFNSSLIRLSMGGY